MVSEEKMMVHGKEGYRKSPGDDLKIIAILNEALTDRLLQILAHLP